MRRRLPQGRSLVAVAGAARLRRRRLRADRRNRQHRGQPDRDDAAARAAGPAAAPRSRSAASPGSRPRTAPSPPTLTRIDFQIDKHGYVEHQGPAGLHAGEARRDDAVAGAPALRRGAGRRRDRQGAGAICPASRAGQISSPLSFFNAPPTQAASRRLIAHAYETVPAPKTLLVPIAIEKINNGRYGYQVAGRAAAESPAATAPRPWPKRRSARPSSAAARRSATSTPTAPAAASRSTAPSPSPTATSSPRRSPRRATSPTEPLGAPLACAPRRRWSSPPRPAAAARWSKSTTSSSAPTAASSRGSCRSHSFAPIDFQGHVDDQQPKTASRPVAAAPGGRSTSTATAGSASPACRPARRQRIANASTEEARRALRAARSSAAARSKR